MTSQREAMAEAAVHAGRPAAIGHRELMAIGAGKGCSPSLRAPRSNSTPEDFTGMGGMG